MDGDVDGLGCGPVERSTQAIMSLITSALLPGLHLGAYDAVFDVCVASIARAAWRIFSGSVGAGLGCVYALNVLIEKF